MVNMNMCLVYRFSKLFSNVALYDNKLNNSPLVDLAFCYEEKNTALIILEPCHYSEIPEFY